MVDFRYHLVSIIAVFLALAVGIVLGTTALNGPVLDDLRGNITRLTSDKRTLEGDVNDLRGDVKASDEFAEAVGPGLVRGDLTDRRVLLVTTPETPTDLVDQLTPLLRTAGAEVTGTLRVLPALADPQQGQLVEDVVAQAVPAGVDLPDGEPVERAAAELAAALVRAEDDDAVEPDEAQAVVSAFEEADLVAYTPVGDTLRPATMALLLTGPAPEEDLTDAEEAQQQALLSLASALDARSDGTVLAGPTTSADARGTVRLLRDDSGLAGEVSTVDNADRGTGRVAVVLALAEQLTGETGQYGARGGATAPLPALSGP